MNADHVNILRSAYNILSKSVKLIRCKKKKTVFEDIPLGSDANDVASESGHAPPVVGGMSRKA